MSLGNLGSKILIESKDAMNQKFLKFILAFVSFLSLTIIPSVAAPESCCVASSAAVTETCLCSSTIDCCVSAPVHDATARDKASAETKDLRQAHLPYCPGEWRMPNSLTSLQLDISTEREPVTKLVANNKRYLFLRVLLI